MLRGKKKSLIVVLGLLIILSILLTLYLTHNTSKRMMQNNSGFAIYLAKDIRTFEAEKMDLRDIPLMSEPIIAEEDILQYNWNEHKIVLKKDAKAWEAIRSLKVTTEGKPFVVICNEERIYLGAFWTLLSSLSPPKCATIITDFGNSKDFLKIDYPYGTGDKRSDKWVYEALKQAEKIK